MRKMIIALAALLAAPVLAGAPAAQAETLIISNDRYDGPRHVERRWHDDRYDRDWRHRRPDRVTERRYLDDRRDRGCMTRKVIRFVDGERVVRTTRVCR
ncbi:hypothetical protein GCM10011390_30470 [Aureimonas endophytica]|uniref:YpeB-like protein with protease inhibitory function n=1 Tax=Aureimonas endophytica TaxID=2027858 RepID=A0A917E6Y1_9HYPH|nr:hypothetical protein [Aureimonas endophytica]GGE09294.1 hypothetical protein GCM10011390_30470 [Aureimonas endophytica]